MFGKLINGLLIWRYVALMKNVLCFSAYLALTTTWIFFDSGLLQSTLRFFSLSPTETVRNYCRRRKRPLPNVTLSIPVWRKSLSTGKNSKFPKFLSCSTVIRPYAGFRHPDRMAPDQTVRGEENDCLIWSGNFLAQVAKFSSIFPKPGIFQRFTWSSVRGVPFLRWYFTFLDAGRHFRNFPEFLPCEKIKSVRRVGSNSGSYGLYSSPLLLHHDYLTWRNTKCKIFFSFISFMYS
jgi:hypothetical protein